MKMVVTTITRVMAITFPQLSRIHVLTPRLGATDCTIVFPSIASPIMEMAFPLFTGIEEGAGAGMLGGAAGAANPTDPEFPIMLRN